MELLAMAGITRRMAVTSVVAVLFLFFAYTEAITNPADAAALEAFHKTLEDPDGHLVNWLGNNPCEGAWRGVVCSAPSGPSNITFVNELRLFDLNLGGTLAPELGNLTQLRYLDVMWNRMAGSIPSTFGKLTNLYLLLLNGNQFTGILPPELGNLSGLNRIQIDENQISGPIPPEWTGLTSIQHLHMNNNSLNGSIPKELGSLLNVVHILLDNNQLTGELPPEISNAPKLLIIQLDNNKFASNATIPPSWANISTLLKLSLRNCGLAGTIPELGGLPLLEVLDLSYNNLNGTIPNQTAFPANLTSIDMSNNQLTGQVPDSIGNLQYLQILNLRSNRLSGVVPNNIGSGQTFHSYGGIKLIDFQNNQFTSFNESLALLESNSTTHVRFAGNPAICDPNVQSITNPICIPNNDPVSFTYDSVVPLEIPPNTCTSCRYITVGYRLKSPGFSVFDLYSQQFLAYLSTGLSLSQHQVVLQDYMWQQGPRLAMNIRLYPVGNNTFNETEFDRLYQLFSQWLIPDSSVFGPYELVSFNPRSVSAYESASKKGLSGGAIAGIVIGAAAVTMLVTGLVLYMFYRRRKLPPALIAQIERLNRAKRNPDLKVTGVKAFTFEELAQATDNFSEKKQIGQGGYGKVYMGIINDGKKQVAIKRAEEGSLQGAHEFYTEIELLSRVHHRNLVMLEGYCDDEGEQMLVYEYMPGGTLRDHLSALSGIPLDFPTRLRIALGSARGILYLHTEANPPIFHRDIKASNILLDNRKVAKVADFGLSRLAPVPDMEGATPGHVSTVVKGTPGYMDPEYFLTHKLTDKSDVYSFGVVLLELITGMHAISKGKNIVRETLQRSMAGQAMSMVDPHIANYPVEALETFMQLALSCCRDMPEARPTMAEVVRDLEALGRRFADDGSSDGFSLDMPSMSSRSSVGSLPTSYPHSSYPHSIPERDSADTSELLSGTVMHVAPR
jgi:serine/threonine protein kinase/Leucine-rich repeat (LRR) protein